jgi:tetratricopeptide (TPR) repeat protein
MNKKDAEKTISRINILHTKGNDKESVEIARELLADNSEDMDILFAVSGCFIDSGGVLGDLEIVDEGLAILHKLFGDRKFSLSEEVVVSSKYNISNGFYTRFQILKKQGKLEEATAELKEAKNFIQDVLLDQNKLDFNLRSQAMCNYGNILDHFDRTVEAIDWYYEGIKSNPDHAVAMANCGIAIRKLINVSGNHKTKNVYEAWNLLSKACEMKQEVELLAGHAAYEYFKVHLENLLSVIERNVKGGINTINNYAIHRVTKHGIPKAEKWLEVINDDRLLLTLNQKPINSESECSDDLFFTNLFTSAGSEGEKRFRDLAHSLNTLKEDFATARYLYYHSSDAQAQFAKHNKITKFADTFDYSCFGIELGVIKTSFRIAADCLDKVAILVNEYYKLHPTANNLNINNIWFKNRDRKQGIHPIVEEILSVNPFLKALKNLQEDWFLETFPGPLKEIRNTATHLKFIIYEMRSSSISSEGNEWNTKKELSTYTYYLLRIVKAAIIYMVCAMNIEENKKDDDYSFRGTRTFELR